MKLITFKVKGCCINTMHISEFLKLMLSVVGGMYCWKPLSAGQRFSFKGLGVSFLVPAFSILEKQEKCSGKGAV